MMGIWFEKKNMVFGYVAKPYFCSKCKKYHIGKLTFASDPINFCNNIFIQINN
jgi:hypothetical protein